MSSVLDMILQWGSTIKVSTELPVATRHRHDITEKLLKATLNLNSHTTSKPVYGGNYSHEAVTLKTRSRSPKLNKLSILFDLYRLANLVTFHPMVHNMQTNTFWLIFGWLSLAVTLKIRWRSPKPIRLFIMSKCYIHANLVKICQVVHEILGTKAPFGSNLAV